MSKSTRRYYTVADKALLWAYSGGRCCFPKCDVELVLEADENDPSKVIGKIAHIEAKSDTGPRANLSLSDRERDTYQNLILLCPNHHEMVDARERTHTVDTLRGWKKIREKKIREMLTEEMARVSFAELEIVTQALVNDGQPMSVSTALIPPREKIARNGLSEQTEKLINIGLLQVKQVQQFVETMSGIDHTFVARLTSGFVNEYRKHKRDGLEGDSMFGALSVFSAQGRSDILYQSAGLAVLVYLFERCEVFEQ